jgi:hypothetical protein
MMPGTMGAAEGGLIGYMKSVFDADRLELSLSSVIDRILRDCEVDDGFIVGLVARLQAIDFHDTKGFWDAILSFSRGEGTARGPEEWSHEESVRYMRYASWMVVTCARLSRLLDLCRCAAANDAEALSVLSALALRYRETPPGEDGHDLWLGDLKSCLIWFLHRLRPGSYFHEEISLLMGQEVLDPLVNRMRF